MKDRLPENPEAGLFVPAYSQCVWKVCLEDGPEHLGPALNLVVGELSQWYHISLPNVLDGRIDILVKHPLAYLLREDSRGSF